MAEQVRKELYTVWELLNSDEQVEALTIIKDCQDGQDFLRSLARLDTRLFKIAMDIRTLEILSSSMVCVSTSPHPESNQEKKTTWVGTDLEYAQSSTMLILSAYEELYLKNKPNAKVS